MAKFFSSLTQVFIHGTFSALSFICYVSYLFWLCATSSISHLLIFFIVFFQKLWLSATSITCYQCFCSDQITVVRCIDFAVFLFLEFFFLWLKISFGQYSLCKIPYFHLISFCASLENFHTRKSEEIKVFYAAIVW